jgi:hypothetical protein
LDSEGGDPMKYNKKTHFVPRIQSMPELSVAKNIAELIEEWKQAELNGVQFPVPLHEHWGIAGHSTKQKAFALLESRLEAGFDYLTTTVNRSDGKAGRKAKALFLTVAALERFCLAAHTEQGDAVRELYRQAKSKWDIVQKIAPEAAAEAELMHLKIELAKIEAQKETAIASGKQADLNLIQFRHLVTSTMPEVIQQKILGYQTIEKTEIVERTIMPDGQRLDGVGITYIQKRYGFKTSKQAWEWLDSIGCGKFSGHWNSELVAIDRSALPRELLPRLDELAQSGIRQPFLGE